MKRVFLYLTRVWSAFLDYLVITRFRSELKKVPVESQFPCFIVAMPDAVHLTICAIGRIPEKDIIVVIANGCSEQEIQQLLLFTESVLKVPRTLTHGLVITALVESQTSPFWILDHDCFILDYSMIEQAEKRHKLTSLGQVFFSNDEKNHLELKDFGTFLMLLNPKEILDILLEFGAPLKNSVWKDLNKRTQKALFNLGFSRNSYPTWKPYFDTFRLVNCLSITKNATFRFTREYSFQFHINEEVVHIGNTSRPFFDNQTNKRYFNVGAFVFAMLFDVFKKNFPDSESMWLDNLPSIGHMENFLEKSGQLTAEELAMITKIRDDFACFLVKINDGKQPD